MKAGKLSAGKKSHLDCDHYEITSWFKQIMWNWFTATTHNAIMGLGQPFTYQVEHSAIRWPLYFGDLLNGFSLQPCSLTPTGSGWMRKWVTNMSSVTLSSVKHKQVINQNGKKLHRYTQHIHSLIKPLFDHLLQSLAQVSKNTIKFCLLCNPLTTDCFSKCCWNLLTWGWHGVLLLTT